MTPETRDELILRHLDGITSREEAAHVTRLLAEDDTFRSRFFSFAHQVAQFREILDTRMTAELGKRASERKPDVANGSTPAMVALSTPAAPRTVEAADALPSKIDTRQIYFNAVLGGIGGLLAWTLMRLIESLPGVAGLNIFVRHLFVGPCLGICIGAAIGSVEGLIASRSLRRLVHGAAYGAGLGAIGGIVGLVLGELIFKLLQTGVWARAIGWAVFGGFIGTSDGFAQKMPAKIRYGILGGLLGGLLGGSTFEVLGRIIGLAWGSAVGLIILGACIGALVGLVESLLRKSWLRFMTGRLEGQTRTLDSSRPHTLGSADSCTVVLPGDPTVAPVHAEIFFRDEDFVVRPRDGDVVLRREGRDLAVTAPQVIRPGDRIHLGDTRMVFRNEEGKKS
jgi:hypothetical protein